MNEHEFAVVSFKTADPKSEEVDRLMEGAKLYVEQKIADGEWTQRDIGWDRIDLMKYPDLSVDGSGQHD